MYIFKTLRENWTGVIKYQKHAFRDKPKTPWHRGEIALISMKKGLKFVKQIQYIMKIKEFRHAPDEVEQYWPGTGKKWPWLADLYDSMRLKLPFDMKDILELDSAKHYGRGAQFYQKIRDTDEPYIMEHLKKNGFSGRYGLEFISKFSR